MAESLTPTPQTQYRFRIGRYTLAELYTQKLPVIEVSISTEQFKRFMERVREKAWVWDNARKRVEDAVWDIINSDRIIKISSPAGRALIGVRKTTEKICEFDGYELVGDRWFPVNVCTETETIDVHILIFPFQGEPIYTIVSV